MHHITGQGRCLTTGSPCEQTYWFAQNAHRPSFDSLGPLSFSPFSLPLLRPSTMFSTVFSLVVLLAHVGVHAQTYSATYLPSNAPAQSEQGQAGTNQCGTTANQTSMCQNAYSELSLFLKPCKERSSDFFQPVNSIDDFCIFAPPEPGADSVIGNTEVRRVGSVAFTRMCTIDSLLSSVTKCHGVCRHVACHLCSTSMCSSALDRMVMERVLYPMVPSLARTS